MPASSQSQSSIELRRAKRLARREEQRKNNVLRAEKMHIASSAAGVETIVPIPAANSPYLNIGCSGWYYWDWRNCFYPPGSPSKDWFPHYASQFGTVELNAPFYSWPTLATVKSWIRQAAGREFIYTVKVCELITHTRRFTGTQGLVRDFGFIADLLGPRMGCFLYQLPPSIKYSPALLNEIVSQLEQGRRNVVEFRHPSWWNDTVYEAFQKAGIIFCSCSAPKLPDGLIKTAEDIYVRFHGTKRWYRHDYSQEELAGWAAQIRESGAQRVWIYFNNDHDCYAPKNARELLHILREPAHRRSSAPDL
jgi:uncharacterized protein YecE (DUF72 family)